jgi:hypothetical protein
MCLYVLIESATTSVPPGTCGFANAMQETGGLRVDPVFVARYVSVATAGFARGPVPRFGEFIVPGGTHITLTVDVATDSAVVTTDELPRFGGDWGRR